MKDAGHDISIPSPGQILVVRNRPAIARDVVDYPSPSRERGTFHLVDVEYIDGWSHPETDRIVWEREVGSRVLAGVSLPRIDAADARPDMPDRLSAFVDAIRWSALDRLPAKSETAEESVNLVSTWHSTVQVEDYQLYPVLKALLMPRVSLLLADDVGLGKTIEAGLILTELIVRRRIRRVLILCPASLQVQWQEEMQEKFSVDFAILDREETFRIQRTLGMDANPWTVAPRIITSMDYLRQPDILERFLATSRARVGVDPVHFPWDLLIVDEAHNLTPSFYGDDSQRARMLRSLTHLFEHRIFLTATPHNGYTQSFTGLLELLDPVRFRQKPEMNEQDHAQVQAAMVRRLKSDLNARSAIPRFAKRVGPEALNIALGPKERALYEALRDYRTAGARLFRERGKRERNLARFLFSLLTKRLLSSSYAFAKTWWEHVEGIATAEANLEEAEHARVRAEAQIGDDEEKEQREIDAARKAGGWLHTYSGELADPMRLVGTALNALGWIRERASGELRDDVSLPEDGRWEALHSWIRERLMTASAFRRDERLILFTEYRHTQDYLVQRLKRAGFTSPEVQEYHGQSPALREAIKAAFNDPDSSVRILVSTDAASEGLNLQMSCRYVIHQDIPWNPMRLEQRNGRVDRHGQARDVYVWHFVCDDDADMNFLAHIARKVEQVREDLGSAGPVIDNAIEEYFSTGRNTIPDLDRALSLLGGGESGRQDMKCRDAGDAIPDGYDRAVQRLRATEMKMGLSPERLYRLFRVAFEMEGGKVEPAGAPGVFRVHKIPPPWEGLVDDSLRIRKGTLASSLPKLSFDAGVFEEEVDGRRLFRPKKDTALLRLGHPVMRRALGVLRRRMWDGGERRDLSRWTITGAPLPSGMDAVLVLYAWLRATNGLRETAHSELLVLPFRLAADRLVPLVEDLWTEIEKLPSSPLTADSLKRWMGMVRSSWPAHSHEIRTRLENTEKAWTERIGSTMRDALKTEAAREKKVFADRLKELDAEKDPKAIERIRKQLRKAEQRRMQLTFIEEDRLAIEEKVRDLERKLETAEWERQQSHIEQLKALLRIEQERTLDKILPRRYSLARVEIQPVAIEYIARSPLRGEER